MKICQDGFRRAEPTRRQVIADAMAEHAKEQQEETEEFLALARYEVQDFDDFNMEGVFTFPPPKKEELPYIDASDVDDDWDDEWRTGT